MSSLVIIVSTLYWRVFSDFLTDAVITWMKTPREIKTCLHENLYINVHFSISVIDEKWLWPKCPSAGGWMNKMWFDLTKEQFSAIKREGSTGACCNVDEPCKHDKWNKPDMKDHICMIPFIWSVQNRQIHSERRVVPRAWDGGRVSDR